MGKNKLRRFADNKVFSNVFQPTFDEVFRKNYRLKGKWRNEYFKNENPIVLELGCGKGEYTVNLAKKFPEKNFIGIDVKGARLWRGAKTAIEDAMSNIAFIRTKIEIIESFFAPNEVNEIWITFPDPQLKTRRTKKRLTSSRFLNSYIAFITNDATINLKTDSQELHEYTKKVLAYNKIPYEVSTNDLYKSNYADDVLTIKTFYESKFLEQGKKITYIRFRLPKQTFNEPPIEDYKTEHNKSSKI